MFHGEINDNPLISIAVGRHFDEEAAYEFQLELARQGIASTSHTFDVGNGTKKIEEHSAQMDETDSATGAKRRVKLGWSWGAGPAIYPDTAGSPETIGVILVAGAIHPNLLKWLGDDAPNTAHSVNYVAYEPQSDKNYDAAKELLRTSIIQTVTDEDIILRWAKKINHRPHPRIVDESMLDEPPTVPISYVILEQDKAILNQDDTRDNDGNLIEEGIVTKLSKGADIRRLRFDSDHAPLISKPRPFARFVVREALDGLLEPAATTLKVS
jgi:hypothetical protein